MKSFILTLTEDQANALGYILRNAHHAPIPNDTILPISREILEKLNDAPENKRDDSLTPRIDMREIYAETMANHPLWGSAS